MLRVSLGPDVLALKGAMVAYQGQVRFDHEKAGSVGRMLKKMATSEDMPLMRVSSRRTSTPQAVVAWSASLAPTVVSSMNMRSMLRGGSGEAVQFAFQGPGFVVVQPSEWTPTAQGSSSGGGGLLGELLS